MTTNNSSLEDARHKVLFTAGGDHYPGWYEEMEAALSAFEAAVYADERARVLGPAADPKNCPHKAAGWCDDCIARGWAWAASPVPGPAPTEEPQ